MDLDLDGGGEEGADFDDGAVAVEVEVRVETELVRFLYQRYTSERRSSSLMSILLMVEISPFTVGMALRSNGAPFCIAKSMQRMVQYSGDHSGGRGEVPLTQTCLSP